MFYTLDKFFERVMAQEKPYTADLSDENAFKLWREKAEEKLMSLLKMDKFPPFTPRAQLGETENMDGYTRQRVLLETEEDIFAPLYILKPASYKEKYPVAIAPHGHGGSGKDAVTGNAYRPEIKGAIEKFNYAYGVELVKRGFLVIAPDARGFGERREWYTQQEHNVLECSCYGLANLADSAGYSLMGMFVIDLIRIADFVCTLEFADKENINCIGLSGGGLQTLYFSALDRRIKNAVVSGYFYAVYKSLFKLPQCSCNYVPNLYENFDMADVGSLIAPRGLFIETGDKDPLNGDLDNALSEVERTRKAYALLSAEKNFGNEVFIGEHRFSGNQSIDWLTDRAMGKSDG